MLKEGTIVFERSCGLADKRWSVGEERVFDGRVRHALIAEGGRDIARNICKNGVVDSSLTLGEYIRHLRRRKGWNLQEMAKETGLSHSHLSRLENDNNLPNPETVVKLAGALGGDLDHMLALAKCLPQEILERLIHRADTSKGVPT